MGGEGFEPFWFLTKDFSALPQQKRISRRNPFFNSMGGEGFESFWFLTKDFSALPQQKRILRRNPFFNSMGGEGFEPSKASPADLQSVPFGHSGIHPFAKQTQSAHSAVYYITFFTLMQVLFLMLPHLPPV